MQASSRRWVEMPFVLALAIGWAAAATSAEGGAEGGAEPRVRYARDVAPILARYCWQCHGPDAEQRAAGLRLDVRASATARLESGRTAIVPGDPRRSELVRRIHSSDDDRMPPEETGKQLSPQQRETVIRWIEQGARWETHWAFNPPTRPRPPKVAASKQPRNPIDRFILARLEQAGQRLAPPAPRRVLLRRASLDLLGVPPTPAELTAFLDDRRPAAWERLVDRLLASPLYGPRWGRHWLDVARYGDSNGGDENHAYPLAWRYRNYVIDAWNADLPYDRFVKEQVAGDLLAAEAKQPERMGAQLTATGFLALGTKILAERDKVKMRADLVDEQIDTLGKAFLALTLGCARCHDHKFDPVPTADYYALAGILHSTQLGDQPVTSPERQREKARYDRRLADLLKQQKRLQQELQGTTQGVLDRQAEKFDRGNVQPDAEHYGKGIGIISDPGAQQNFAEYDLQLPAAGKYLLQLRYAAKAARPGRILLNGKVVRPKAIAEVTGGWMPEHQRWHAEGVHRFSAGKSVLRIESAPLMSHLDRFRLIRVGAGGRVQTALKRLERMEAEIAALRRNPPAAVKVMAAREGKAANVRIHVRGSHLSMGKEVPRGFPAAVSAVRSQPQQVAGPGSGRRQLADWITDPQTGAGGQAARVIVNRLWHWHFGQGLVGTPDNFGVQGRRPTHPELLDWLATELIRQDWSLKAIHRLILNSATWRQSTTAQRSPLYRGMPRRRLDAEAIRDSLLFHAGRLDFSLAGRPLSVKSQDPSPQDLQRNERVYREARVRSVYLPVVRSNVVRFLTLFDFPNAATPVGRRDTTTVPTQALLLMNDPFVLEQAEALAKRILAQAPQEAEAKRIEQLYLRLFGRRPERAEMEAGRAFLRAFSRTGTSGKTTEPANEAAWTALCQTLLSSNEFVYVE